MRWQKVARGLLVVGGLSLAVAIYVLTRERPQREADPPPPPPEEREATQAGRDGVMVMTRDGQKVGDLYFARDVRYPDGRMRFERVRYVDLRGFSFIGDAVVARSAPTLGATPTELEIVGAMTLEDESGLKVETENATYDDVAGVLTMPGEVTFSRGRMSGRGVGGIYERDTETIRLLAEATVRIAADAEGKGGADASSRTMTLRRTQKSLEMHDEARIVTEAETLSADLAHLFFTEDESALRFLELRGNASVVPADPGAGGAPEMRANDITMSFHPDGRAVQHATLTGSASLQLAGGAGRSMRAAWIDLFTAADGRTLTRLEGKGDVVVALPRDGTTPAREIRAATMVATGREPKGLERAEFRSSVRFEERRGGKGEQARTVTSAALVLGLAGGLDAIERAEFQRDAVFVDGPTRGNADSIVYDAANERVQLTPGERTPPRIPQVRDEDVTVNAPSIDVDLVSDDLRARGGVTTVSTARKQSRTALFEGDEPILGAGADFEYRRATRTATYTGKARIMQGRQVIEGAVITLAEETGNLEAGGGVLTTFLHEAEAGAAPTEYRTTAQTFTYDDGKRLAVYRSPAPAPAVEMTGSDKTLTTGRVVSLTFASESRAIESLRVDGDVWARLADGTEVKGESLTYREATGIYVLTGTPAEVLSAPDGKSKTCTKTVGETIEFDQRTKAVTQRRVSQAFNQAMPWPCGKSIR